MEGWDWPSCWWTCQTTKPYVTILTVIPSLRNNTNTKDISIAHPSNVVNASQAGVKRQMTKMMTEEKNQNRGASIFLVLFSMQWRQWYGNKQYTRERTTLGLLFLWYHSMISINVSLHCYRSLRQHPYQRLLNQYVKSSLFCPLLRMIIIDYSQNQRLTR